MPIHFHIDGKPVKLNDDWEATSTAAGGYEQLTASCPRKEILHAHQGSGISLTTSNRKIVWSGTLDATPSRSRHPVAQITATGPVAKLRRLRGNRLYQSRDYSLWGPITSDPHNINAIGALNVKQTISADAQTGRIIFNTTNGTDIKQNDANGVCFWGMGEAVTRVAFDWTSKAGSGNYVMRVYTATGPSGTLTQRGADITFGTSGSIDYTLNASDADLLAIVLYWSAADATTASNFWVRVGNLRVNGRTLGDDASPGAIIADIASAAGIQSPKGDVRSSGQNALPFYWIGGAWSDAVTELATLDDWPWLVSKRTINYTPWDNKWTLAFAQENEDLNFPPLYNSVRVFYTTLAGAPRSVKLQAHPDPLGQSGEDFEYPYDLGQAYPDDTIPTAVAGVLLEHVSRQRVVGTVTLSSGQFHQTSRVWTPHKRYTVGYFGEEHYRILPGDLGKLEPYPNLDPQRIVSVRLHAHDVQVAFGEDVEAISAGTTLARRALQNARHKVRLNPKK
jgi:hypothetical protein